MVPPVPPVPPINRLLLLGLLMRTSPSVTRSIVDRKKDTMHVAVANADKWRKIGMSTSIYANIDILHGRTQINETLCAGLGVTRGLAPARGMCGGGELSRASVRVSCLCITLAVYQQRPDQYFKNLLAAFFSFVF